VPTGRATVGTKPNVTLAPPSEGMKEESALTVSWALEAKVRHLYSRLAAGRLRRDRLWSEAQDRPSALVGMFSLNLARSGGVRKIKTTAVVTKVPAVIRHVKPIVGSQSQCQCWNAGPLG
jgi:hypothetical protein